ncbi:MAG TPA: carbohydrate-binding protein [Yinghuangia sp.]|nr:carbohydrate-binding protein [Yinghuangia sp.]
MTVGTEGEPEDPYGYLYRPGPGEAQGSGQAAPAGFGTSPYVQVGQTRYGPPPPQYAPPPGSDAQTQAIPGVVPGGPPPGDVPPPRRGGGGSRGGSRGSRGPVVGAVVALVVVIGVIAAVVAMNGSGDDKKDTAESPTPTAPASSAPPSSAPPSSAPPSSAKPTTFGETEAEEAQLQGGARMEATAGNFSGAGYVGGLNSPGAAITVTFDAPEKGTYSLYVRYANPEPSSDAKDRPKQMMTVLANGEAKYGQLNMYGTGGVDKWWTTYRTVELKKGENTVSLACQAGDTCNVTVDKMWVAEKQN